MQPYLNQTRHFMSLGVASGGAYGISPKSASPRNSGQISPPENEMADVYNNQIQTAKKFSTLHHKMKLYDDNINAGVEKPYTTFTMDNLNPNLKQNYPQLPGEKTEKPERKILQAGAAGMKLKLSNDFQQSISTYRSRQQQNLSVEIRNKPKLGHLPNTDMRIRANQELGYFKKMAERKNKALELLQKYENQKIQQSPRIQELFSKSIIGQRKKLEHSTGDNWWVQDSKAHFRTMRGSSQSEGIDSPSQGFTTNFLNSERVKIKTPNTTTYIKSTKPDDSVFGNSQPPFGAKNDDLFGSKFSNNENNYSDLEGESYLNQTITSFQFQKNKRNSHFYPGQTSAMNTINPNSVGRKELLHSQLQARKILKGIRNVTPSQQSIVSGKQLGPLKTEINRNPMLLHGIEESKMRNKFNKTVYQHVQQTVNKMPTQGQYNRREPKLQKVRVISQHQAQIDKSKFQNIHHYRVIEELKRSSIFDEPNESEQSQEQEAHRSSMMTKSIQSPGRKTKFETNQSSEQSPNSKMDRSPNSKMDKMLSINVIVDAQSPLTSLSNSMRQQVRMKTLVNGTMSNAEKVSEEYESSSEEEESQGVKKMQKYLMNSDPLTVIDQMDKRIEVKKAENEEEYYNKFHNNSVLDSLNSKRGKIFIHPCFLKMQIFKYISEVQKTNHRFEIDFNDPIYNQECTHEFAEDHAAEFIENIKQWVIEYEEKIQNSKKDKIDKTFLYDKLYRSILLTSEDEFQILKQNIESSNDLKEFIDKNFLKIQTQHIEKDNNIKIKSLLETESDKKILIFDQQNRISIPEGVFEMIMQTYKDEVEEEIEKQKNSPPQSPVYPPQSLMIGRVISVTSNYTNMSDIGDPFFNYAKDKLDQLIVVHQKKLDKKLQRRKTKEREIEKARKNKREPTVELVERQKTTMEIVKQSLIDNVKKQKAKMVIENSPEVLKAKGPLKAQGERIDLLNKYQINQKFYQDSKKLVSNPNSQESKIRTMYYDQVDNNSLPQPVYSKIKNNVLMISGEVISVGQARAIKNFLVENKNDAEFQVVEVIFEDCLIAEKDLTIVLEGVMEQEKLKSITLCGVGINEDACNLLCEVFQIQTVTDSIHTVNLSQVKIQQKHLLMLMEALTEGMKVQTLSLNMINLGGLVDSMPIIWALYKLITECFSLNQLNLSGCSMSGNEFERLSEGLKENMTIRSLDLSYLDLSYTLASKQTYVTKFLENLTEWIGSYEQSKNLSHLNLSGMGLKHETVIPLIKQIIKHPVIIGIHLSDNHLDGESRNQIMKLFGVDNSFYTKTHDIDEKKFNNTDELDLTYEVQKQGINHGQKLFTYVEDQKTSSHSSRHQARVLNNEIMKNFNEVKKINQVKTYSSQRKRLIQNPFIFTRIHGHPELIYNRNKNKQCLIDFTAGDGRWEVQAEEKQCYICNNWSYISIYFRPTIIDDSYQEIDDQKVIKELRKCYKLVDSQQNKKPIVLGSVVNGVKTCMLQVKHYACLLLQQALCKQSAKELNPVFLIKAMRKELQLDIQNQQQSEENDAKQKKRAELFNDHFVNWRVIIQENLNNIKDYQNINMPQFNPYHPAEDNIYIYSGFISPGRHSVVIYNPLSDKFYLKNIIVQHRKSMIDQISKENTIQVSKIGINRSRNVFLDWKMPTLDGYQFAVQSNLHREQDKTLQEVINRNSIGFVQLHHMLISKSLSYPVCLHQDLEALFNLLNLDLPSLEEAPQTLTRTQFIDILLKTCEQQATANNITHSEAILTLMNQTILPFLMEQGSHRFRVNAIQTREINDEIYVNIEGIKKLFKKYYNYEQNTFPFECLYKMFQDFMIPAFGEEMTETWMNEKRINALMAESKMIAIDDVIQIAKYNNIALVELLEFLVRAAQSMFNGDRLKQVMGDGGSISPGKQAQFNQFLEVSGQGLHLKLKQLLMMLLNSQPKGEDISYVHIEDYEFQEHEVDIDFKEEETQRTTELEKTLGFKETWKEQVNDPLQKLMIANDKLIQQEQEEAEARRHENESMNNFDDEEEEKVVTTKKVFHIREMEFVFEGAEEVARVNDSETSDIESSQDEVEGEAK